MTACIQRLEVVQPRDASVVKRTCGKTPRYWRWVSLVFVFAAGLVAAQDPTSPLKPLDRSSPRATLKTFLEAGDTIGTFLAEDYLPAPSREKFHHLISLAQHSVDCLDLSRVPPAAREKEGRAAAAALYETLNRITLPPWDEIPDSDPPIRKGSTNAPRWVIPDTEIVLVQVPSGPYNSEYLFSADTVAKASQFYSRVREQPYVRAVPVRNLPELLLNGGGWLIHDAWIEALPAWFRTGVMGQAVWKWVGLVLLLGLFSLALRWVYRLSLRGGAGHPFLRALAQSAMPAFLLAASPAFAYLALVQLNLTGVAGSVIELLTTAVMFLSGAWIAWRLAPVVAEAIIASPKIPPESIDAHLIRTCMRLLGIVAGAVLLAVGADRLGLPVYGIVAGLGVGGLAIALAAQPSIENLIGGMSLFADKPIRVGDLCQHGNDLATVEAIGIRSTRIRGLDRTLTTIPNAVLAKMPIVNFTQRDRMLIRSVIGLRYETSSEQLRHVLVKLREMLLAHPRIHPGTARVRFVGFGSSSLDLELFGYAMTRDRVEFLALQEDVLLRIIDIVEQSGTGFAFPSQTLYMARDAGLDADRTQAAEEEVRRWREEGRLPFPQFSPDQSRQLRGKGVYPPAGSPDDRRPATGIRHEPSAPGEASP